MERFDEIDNFILQTHNRAVLAFNLFEDSGVNAYNDYLESFESKFERNSIATWVRFIQKHGRDSVARAIRSTIDEVAEEVV